jgi:hypothetical protein
MILDIIFPKGQPRDFIVVNNFSPFRTLDWAFWNFFTLADIDGDIFRKDSFLEFVSSILDAVNLLCTFLPLDDFHDPRKVQEVLHDSFGSSVYNHRPLQNHIFH